MKKIIFTAIALFTILAVNAQTERGATAKKADSNKEPLVNGIPYSQYKAQQEALKTKQSAQGAPLVSVPVVTMAKDAATPAVTTPTQVIASAPAAEKQPSSLQTVPTIGKADIKPDQPSSLQTTPTIGKADIKPDQSKAQPSEKPKGN